MQAPQWHVARLMDGYLVTQMLYVTAALGVADALADGPRTGVEVADAVGADPTSLHRVLRGLAVEEIVDERDDGRFALTAAGELLRSDVPGSLRGAVLARGDVYYEAVGHMLDGVRGEGVAYQLAHGAPFFDHLARHPERERSFQASMAGRADQETADVVAAYDFSGIGRLVDVGGGAGNLLAAILSTAPGLTGVLFDRPGVVPAAQRRMRDAGVADRCELVSGDFFDAIPGGADVYVLSRVLHDWSDEDAARILARVSDAMAPGSRLLVVEALLPERAMDLPTAIRMDIHMMLLFSPARERTEAEFRGLLGDAGLTLQSVIPTHSPAGVCLLEAVR
jgi:O-methyltransferase domain/Dimerisation domain